MHNYEFTKEWHRRNMGTTEPCGGCAGDLVDAVMAAARKVDPLDPHDEWSEVHIFSSGKHVGTVGKDRWCRSMWKLVTSLSKDQFALFMNHHPSAFVLMVT